jgi:hypothetical protein
MMPILPTLLIAITAAGLLHTIGTHYRDNARQRRTREVMERLGMKPWKPLD